MNKLLKEMLESGCVKSHRTLVFIVDHIDVAYVSEYIMDSKLGPFTWYCTWKCSLDVPAKLAAYIQIIKYPARAKTFMPGTLERRFPPRNRIGLDEYLSNIGLKEYNKFDILSVTKGESFAMPGTVKEVEPRNCELDDIFCIEQIYDEWKAELNKN